MYRVITPLDQSPLAEPALILSSRLTERLRGTLELVHVIDSSVPTEQSVAHAVTDARCYLNEVADRYRGNTRVEVRVLCGQPVEELLRFFNRRGDETIVVMNRHGRTALRRTSFGSVAVSLMRGTRVPLLLASDAHPNCAVDLSEILVPLDGSDIASSAIPLALEIAGSQSRLCLMRVVQPRDDHSRSVIARHSEQLDATRTHDIATVAIDEAREFLLRTATRLRRSGVNVSWEVRFGDPSNEIVRAATTSGAQLIVMATHGLGGARHWTFGSVTESVIRHGTTPILIVPPGRI